MVADLSASPLFNLSLCSRELFHSNFLKWLWDSFPGSLESTLHGALDEGSTGNAVCVLREKKNTDLLVKTSEGRKILIENKVKSLPDQSQLARYAQKFSDEATDFVLLSLVAPEENADFIRTDDVTWRYLSYAQLAGNLFDFVIPDIGNFYRRSLIEDYAGCAKNLSEIASAVIAKIVSGADVLASPAPELAEIGISDLEQKLRHALLAREITRKLNGAVANGDWRTGLAGDTFVFSGMTRGLGFTDVKRVVRSVDNENPAAVFGVQAQGGSVRLYFEDESSGEDVEAVSGKLREAGLWFDFSVAPEFCGGGREYPEKGFNRYGKTFRYRSRKLSGVGAERLAEIFLAFLDLTEQQPEAVAGIVGK